MPKICYFEKRFNHSSKILIEHANKILAEYAQRGLVVTLRQLYYQFVSRDIIPNNQKEYKRLGSVVNDARLAGLIDWDYMQDRTRNLARLASWDSTVGIIRSAARSYHRNLWEGQKNYVEVWIEKDALVGVIEQVCERYDVPFFSCRGYTSQSEMWAAARRFQGYERQGRKTHMIHLGDHDPSGKDMSRDITDRMNWTFGSTVSLNRIALNMNQVEQYNPPPNPAKITDSRAEAYISEFGEESWELDALNPEVLEELIESSIGRLLNRKLFDKVVERQESERKVLTKASTRWSEVETFLESLEEE
jgi:hypothetical protein